MKILLLLAVLVIAVCAVLLFIRRSKSNDDTVGVESDDPEMTAAIAEARAMLPQYWQVLAHPEHGESDFSLKVRITDGRTIEHFWAVDIEQKDGAIFGTIDNDPEVVRSVKQGDRIQISEDEITDWGYVRGGKMYGKYTLRAVLNRLPPQEAAKYRRMLADQ